MNKHLDWKIKLKDTLDTRAQEDEKNLNYFRRNTHGYKAHTGIILNQRVSRSLWQSVQRTLHLYTSQIVNKTAQTEYFVATMQPVAGEAGGVVQTVAAPTCSIRRYLISRLRTLDSPCAT